MPRYSLADKEAVSSTAAFPFIKPIQKRSSLQLIADRLGICLSFICIVHCLLTPVLLLALPMMQVFESYHGSLHLIFAFVIPLLALAAFVPGYRLHRDTRVLKMGLTGFVLIVCGIIIPHALEIEWLVPVITIPGSVFLIRAHLLNRNLCACCRTGHGKH